MTITTGEYKNVNEEEIKAKHRKRLLELSEDLEFVVTQLDEPSYEQKEWFVRKMKGCFV